MKTAIYPGSFNPWHAGHEDIVNKALQVFDKVIVLTMKNPEKKNRKVHQSLQTQEDKAKGIQRDYFEGLLVEAVSVYQADAVIRGLRNGNDLQYEMNQQYWNEDIGVEVPFVYFITKRELSHVSSSAIRTMNELGLVHSYERANGKQKSWVDNCD